jgi:hypothetical protein
MKLRHIIAALALVTLYTLYGTVAPAKTCTQYKELDGSIVITCDDGTRTVILPDLFND